MTSTPRTEAGRALPARVEEILAVRLAQGGITRQDHDELTRAILDIEAEAIKDAIERVRGLPSAEIDLTITGIHGEPVLTHPTVVSRLAVLAVLEALSGDEEAPDPREWIESPSQPDGPLPHPRGDFGLTVAKPHEHPHECGCTTADRAKAHQHGHIHEHPVEHIHEHEHPTDAMVVQALSGDEEAPEPRDG
jgi:hypothetical protein